MSHTKLELFLAWKLFIVALIVPGLLNYLTTRFWLASLFVALGQMVLLSEFLVLNSSSKAVWLLPVSAGLFLAAAAAVSWQCRKSTSPDLQGLQSLDIFTREWLSFRNAYGAFWGLRVVGRVNQTAEIRDWPMRLTWSGFELIGKTEPTFEHFLELDQAMATLLRRFTRR